MGIIMDRADLLVPILLLHGLTHTPNCSLPWRVEEIPSWIRDQWWAEAVDTPDMVPNSCPTFHSRTASALLSQGPACLQKTEHNFAQNIYSGAE